MNLPIFPQMQLLSLTDKPAIQKYCKEFLPSADYNFLSLWSYNTENDAMVATLNENLVIRFRDYITGELFYSFLGKNRVTDTASALLQKAQEEHIPQELKLIQEDILSADNTLENEFTVSEDRGNFDYILSVADMLHLSGKKFHTQKNHLNKFHALYPHAQTRIINVSDPNIQEEILSVFDRWVRGRQKSREETEHELTAIKRVLHDAEHFKLLVLGLYVQNQLVGFSINDLENTVYAQNHFAKSDPSYKQLYYKLNHVLAQELDKRGYKYLNIECDLDIPGLRYAKEQWNPIKYLKKYNITKKL